MLNLRLLRASCWLAVLALAIPAAAQDAAAKRQREITELIAQLGADDYHARQRAQDKLAELGVDAFDALAAAQNHTDTEIASRARFLLRTIRVELAKEADDPQVKEILKDYAGRDEAQRLAKIGQLSRLSGDIRLGALCRLVRFEQSEALSKQAAIHVINQTPPPTADWKARAEAITASLGASQRTGARWVRSYVDANRGRAEAAAKAWAAYAEEEAATLRRSPQQTHADVVVGLLRYHVALLDGLKRREESLAAIRQLIEVHPDKEDQLIELIDWIRTQKAWPALSEVEKRFKEVVDKNPLLLYALATARGAEGKSKLAGELAAAALALNGGDQRSHWRSAILLRNRGMLKWAEQEFRRVFALPPVDSVYGITARHVLAEMLHDQGSEEQQLQAAKVMEDAVEAVERNVKAGKVEENYGYEPGSSKARMHYYYAMHYQNKDPAKHIEHLDKAVEADATEADALIALYRLPKQDEARKAKTLKLIEAAANKFRQQIREKPDNPTPYNQFAWLVGNTEGDYQEALQNSQKSLDLRPGTAAFLDTLGRCYYAKSDYANAVKHQRMAVEKDPHSGQMRRQLELFEKAAAEAAGKKE